MFYRDRWYVTVHKYPFKSLGLIVLNQNLTFSDFFNNNMVLKLFCPLLLLVSAGSIRHNHFGSAISANQNLIHNGFEEIKHRPPVTDEAMFYELWISGDLSRRHLERYMRHNVENQGQFHGLSDENYNLIMQEWIFQMLPGGF